MLFAVIKWNDLMWFEQLTGFKETSLQDIRNNLLIDGDAFISKVNNEKFTFGSLQIPTLEELKQMSFNKRSLFVLSLVFLL